MRMLNTLTYLTDAEWGILRLVVCKQLFITYRNIYTTIYTKEVTVFTIALATVLWLTSSC